MNEKEPAGPGDVTAHEAKGIPPPVDFNARGVFLNRDGVGKASAVRSIKAGQAGFRRADDESAFLADGQAPSVHEIGVGMRGHIGKVGHEEGFEVVLSAERKRFPEQNCAEARGPAQVS